MILREPYSVLLRPLSLLYGIGVALRNFAFENGILKEETYPIPIICVGNITVGGTGKTPHVEYILQTLLPQYKVAVLSRGYKRKVKGQVIAQVNSSIAEIGDEPKQLKLKFPAITLVVDGNRRRAMKYLMSLPRELRPDVVVMDDGLQHRYVKPSYSILLMDSTRPLQEDKLLPEGRLREPATARYRVDCIIATKCPDTLQPIQQRLIERNLSAYPHQAVFFTKIGYKSLRNLSTLVDGHNRGVELSHNSPILALSGIANPSLFIEHLEKYYQVVEKRLYSDHHNFDSMDLQTIIDSYKSLSSKYAGLSIVCTEKDAVRLVEHLDSFPEDLKNNFYFLPIEVGVIHREEELKRQLNLAAKSKPASLQEIK